MVGSQRGASMDVLTALPVSEERESIPSPLTAPSFAQTAQVSCIAGAMIVFIGMTVLSGWLVGWGYLEKILAVWVAMAPSTAVCFALAGIVLIGASFDDPV